jgi:16S rRNA (adenine1518-N6/adenine1519-N6)-dimethyltransferase
MSQTKQQILDLLAQAGARPRQQLGQNFMIDRNLVAVVADAGELRPGNLVIEVGPGTGTLTDELLGRGVEVLAVEIDRGLARLLRERLTGQPRFRLIEADVLAGKHALCEELREAIAAATVAGQPVKLVANLPYNVASPLIVELLLAGVELLACTVQREVADRLRASAGGTDYGALSVIVQLLADVERLRILPPQAFWPAPKVASALVRLRRRDRVGAHARDFGQFVQKLFSGRRKTLRKILTTMGIDAETALAAVGVDGQKRPEELGAEVMLELHLWSTNPN